MSKSRRFSRRAIRLPACLCVALAIVGLGSAGQAAKTDIVILRNGDRITGEVKRLTGGRLEYKTDDMDRIYIEWEKIRHVSSINRFEVVDAMGIRRYGSIGRTEAPYEVVVEMPAAADTLDLRRIVRITPVKIGFFERLRGSISTGFSYTRATKTSEFTLSGNTGYRSEKYDRKIDYSVYITDQSEKRTSRFSFGLTLDRFLRRRWTIGAVANGQHNEELGLDLRLSLAVQGTRYLVETNKTILKFSLGLAGNQERYIGSDSTTYNLEIPIEAEYRRFTFHNPKSNIGLSGTVYPSLTASGRYRGSLNVDLDHEIYKDLFFVIGFYYDYDNKPPSGAAKDDYRFNTSIKWSFG
jgi:hypothetical protein